MQQTLNLITLVFFCCLLQLNLSGQQIVYPGDVNNNGVVSGVDLLYFGAAFQKTGEARSDASLNWLGQEVDQPWGEEFPEGVNLSHADADGNGIVDESDLLGGIVGNFEKNHGTIGSEGYQNGIEGVDPMIVFEPQSTTAYPNSEIGFDIILGSEYSPISEFYGISFIASFDVDVIDPTEGVKFQIDSNSWLDDTGTNHRKIATLRSDGSIEFAITRLNKVPVSGNGTAAQFYIIIEDFVSGLPADSVTVSIDSVRLTNQNLQTFPIAVSQAKFALSQNGGFNPPSANCPDIVAPVCGSNGFTYLNSCFALEAGVTDFTPGVCYSDCIEPTQINPNATCSTVYDPVCGCNDVTYTNACEADAAGVTAYTSGACNSSNCYNPQQVVSSGNTTVNPDNGVITTNCPGGNDPVCGCDGITYPNACMAEASGITFYTSGSCGTCVDPWTMDPDALCTYDYEPVCGCNDVTYLNACQATAAGITDFTTGACGSASTWCNEAIPIQCGDFLPNETTIGAGNDISVYQNCISSTMVGPDRVYVINKNTPGDLQIGLEITTPNMDLDLILLDANCSAVTCLAASHTNNSQTNNEGILYEDAPIGTYYIVVDGQYADSEGNYRLEVSCAYLDCSEAKSLTCGVPHIDNNIGGNDNVSLYHCGNVLNVENNGPEMVHTFTVTEPGQIDISLTGLSANLELFLLDACDNSECLKYSQNGGSNSEFITTFLAAGTYYIIVDGYNGATSDYNLQVNCEGSCNLDFAIQGSSSNCLDNDGSLTISTENGTAPYIISWSGNGITGTIATYQPTYIIEDLTGGNYTVTVTDGQGCEVIKNGNIFALGGLNFSATTMSGTNCIDQGNITVNILNGSPNFQIKIDGPVANLVTINSSTYTFENLPAGDYVISVNDGNGCFSFQDITLGSASGLTFEASPNAAECDQLGSIDIDVFGGTAPYNVYVTGTVNGSGTAQTDNFSIQNLPGGTYIVTIEDNTGCESTQQVEVANFQLDISATAFNGVCDENGSISVSVNAGTPPFSLEWSGAAAGTASNSSGSFIISNLPTGSYSIQVTDGDGCTDFQTISLDNSAPAIDVEVTTFDANCDEPGYIFISMNNGVAPYTISYSGQISGNETTNSNFYTISNAVAGSYNITVSDINGCSYSESVTVEGGSPLSFQATAGSNNCGQNGSINVNVFNGDAPFVIVWNGPDDGSMVTNNVNSVIENLTSGTYSIEVTDSNGCAEWATVEINTTNSLTFTAVANNGDCGENGTISVNIVGGTAAYDVSWNGPIFGSFNTSGTSFLIPDLPSGTYSIQITDSNGCNAMQTVTLINGGGSNLTATFTPNPGSCGQNGAIAVSITSGNGPYLVEYDGPASGFQSSVFGSNFNFPNLPSGNYIFTITSGNDCSITESVFLTPGNAMTFLATTDEGTCGQFGDITLDISGGNAPYNISWTGPTSSSVTVNSNSYTIPNLLGGTYTIIINDNSGCSIQQAVILDNGENVQFWATPNAGDCGELGSILVDVGTGVAPFTISWSGASAGTTTTVNPNFTISNLVSDSYNVTVFDADGCGDTQTVLLNNANNLNLTVSTNDGSCGENGSLTLNFSGGNAPYTINYNGAASGNFTANGNATLIPNLPTGNYNITVTSADGCVVSQAANLNNGDGIAIWVTPNDGTCTQSGNILVDVTGGVAPFSIQWSGASSGSANFNTNIYTIPNLTSGNYTVTVFDANGCVDSKTTTLNNTGGVTLSASTNNGSCGQNGSISLNLSGGNAPYTINYNGAASGNFTANGNATLIPNLPTGNYNITVTNADGCVASQAANLNNGDDIAIWVTPNNGTCTQSGSILVDVTGGVAPFSIQWSGASSGSATSNSNIYTIPNLTSGSYTVIVFDANGCVDSKTTTLNNAGGVTLSASANNGSCGQNGSITLNFSGGNAPYTINYNGASSGSFSENGNATIIPNLPTGNYNITVTNADGCSATQSATILNSGNISIWATPNNGNCGQQGSILVDVTGGTAPFTYTWTGQSNGSTTNNSPNYTIPNLFGGNYTVSVTDANGCSASQNATLTSSNPVNLFATANNGSCGNAGSIDLNFSGGNAPFNIAWNGTSSGNNTVNGNVFTIPNLQSGNYNITVINSDGCVATQSATVNNSGSINFAANPNNGSCGNAGSIDVSIADGTAPYTLNWSGAATGSFTINNTNTYTISALPTGSYNLMLTDANGCSSSQSVTLNNGFAISFAATPANGSCGQLGSIALNVSGGNGDYLVLWASSNANGSAPFTGSFYTIQNLESGTYSVVVSDSNGCSSTQSLNINNGTTLNFITTGINGACGQNGQVNLIFSNGNPPFNVTWAGTTNGTIEVTGMSAILGNLPTGNYNIDVTDSNNCSGNTSVAINNGTGFTINTTGTDVTCNGANNGSATVTVNGSTGTLTYAWSNNGTTATINTLAGDTYSVTVTDQNGCEEIASVVVTEPAAIVLATSATNASCGGSNGSATVNPSGGNAPYSFFWNNTGTGQTIFGITPDTYSVTVTDANSCTQTASVVVGNDSQNTIADFNTNANGLNISFANTAIAATTYAWDFGDGNTSNLPNVTHTYCEEGTYNVCLTTTNDCNENTYCENINVMIPANYAILNIGEITGNSGDIVNVPVSIQNVATLASVAGSIEVENIGIGTITGISAGVITPSFNPALNTFSFFSGSGVGQDVNNGDILFYINVEINGNAGDVTPVNIVNNPLSIEIGIMQNGVPTLAPHAILKGSAGITTITVATINGNIQTWWGDGINNVTVDVWNDNSDETYYTDIDGNYFTNPMTAGETFIFEPSKDTLDSNGISTFGLFVGQQYILGNEPPQITSPYQIIAGDANCNGIFSTLDLFAIQQQLIGTTDAFADCPSWVFVPEGFSMPGLDNPQGIFPYPSMDTMLVTVDAESNFIGVKIGDLLGDANPELLLSADDRSGDFVLTAKNQTAQAGDIIEISLSAKELKEIATMQFALNFDNHQLQFLTIENGKIKSPLTALFDNELRFSWFDLSGNGLLLNEKEQLFTLRFQALQNVADLAESLHFKNDAYKSVAFETTGAAYDLRLYFENEIPTFNEFNLYQNVPNPFGEVTTIQFMLPEAAFVKMTIQNSRGEVMQVIENDFAEGVNNILVEKAGLSGGVYYYTLETEGFVRTRRMVVL